MQEVILREGQKKGNDYIWITFDETKSRYICISFQSRKKITTSTTVMIIPEVTEERKSGHKSDISALDEYKH